MTYRQMIADQIAGSMTDQPIAGVIKPVMVRTIARRRGRPQFIEGSTIIGAMTAPIRIAGIRHRVDAIETFAG